MRPATLVLVVEDDDLARERLADLLRGAGYGVLPAVDGEQALRLLRDGPRPDLILLDMLMPVLDGWHFLRRLPQEGPHPPVPVGVSTGNIRTREGRHDHAPQGFVRKPIETDDLLREVRRCVAEASPAGGEAGPS